MGLAPEEVKTTGFVFTISELVYVCVGLFYLSDLHSNLSCDQFNLHIIPI